VENLLANPNFWAAVSAIASAVSAMAALVVVYQAALAQKKERESRRAYFRVVSDEMEFAENGAARLPLVVSNVGSHPATNITAKLVIVAPFEHCEPLTNLNVVLANELVQGGELNYRFSTVKAVPADTPRQLVLFALRYTDSVLNKTFTQRFYFEWLGMVNGQPSKALTHGLMDRDKAEVCLKKYLDEFTRAAFIPTRQA
jgi:hypothetical protein